jgi:hypothetical protein
MARGTIEGCMSIDIRSWHREGLLRVGQCFLHSLTWNWEPTEGIGVLRKADGVVLMFRSRSWPDKYGPTIMQRIPIAWTLCTLGGRRPWFRCEARPNGSTAAVGLLSCIRGAVSSPAATALAWSMIARTRRPSLRAIRRVRKIRMRLGAGFSFAEPFPDKPPGMHWRTYLRMRVAAGEAIALHDQLMPARGQGLKEIAVPSAPPGARRTARFHPRRRVDRLGFMRRFPARSK